MHYTFNYSLLAVFPSVLLPDCPGSQTSTLWKEQQQKTRKRRRNLPDFGRDSLQEKHRSLGEAEDHYFPQLQTVALRFLFIQVEKGPLLSCHKAGTDLNMGRAREVGWMTAGLMIGAGACYCVYKLTLGRDDREKWEEEEEEWEDDQELDEEDPEMWFDFTTMARPWNEDGNWTAPGGTEHRPLGGGKASRTHPIRQRPFPYEHKNTWSAKSFKIFSCAFDLFKCPFIQGNIFFAQPKDAGFSFSQNINSHLVSISIVGNVIPIPNPTIKEAFCALDNVDASVENQCQIKMFINELCQETVSHCRNSFLQHVGLNLLIRMTIINNMLAKSISDLKFPLIPEGSRCAEVQVLKLLMGLSEKPVSAGKLLGPQMLLSFMFLFIRNGKRQVHLDTLSS